MTWISESKNTLRIALWKADISKSAGSQGSQLQKRSQGPIWIWVRTLVEHFLKLFKLLIVCWGRLTVRWGAFPRTVEVGWGFGLYREVFHEECAVCDLWMGGSLLLVFFVLGGPHLHPATPPGPPRLAWSMRSTSTSCGRATFRRRPSSTTSRRWPT